MLVTGLSPFALFDDATWPHKPALLLTNPSALIEATNPDAVPGALAALDGAIGRGQTVAGYCAYELGYCFERRLQHLAPAHAGPLLRFHVFEDREWIDARARTRWLLERATGPAMTAQSSLPLSLAGYRRRFDRVHQLIGDGDVYQVNLTMKLKLHDAGDALQSYLDLRDRARTGACSLLHFDDEDVLSLSPEKFFSVKGGRISVRPMKGTVPRKPDCASDRQAMQALRNDPKQRAENLMIVDLMRNDISRVCIPGSVRVDDLFTVETYPTFHTLTSGVSGNLSGEAKLSTLLPALFPCGSVTGAPKIRAMEIIREVEGGPRGVYCGAIGFASKDLMAFNVAIRTISLRHDEAVMGVGGGIVWDSDAVSEYEESRLKARFFTDAAEPIRLIETIRWSHEAGFYLLDRHFTRLAQSCAYFGFVFDRDAVTRHLMQIVDGKTGTLRLRLTLGVRGDTQIESEPLSLPVTSEAWRYVIALKRVDTSDWRLYHKTTRRDIYEQLKLQTPAHEIADEIVLVNERGEVTEGCRSNLFVERDGIWLTPPLSSGLLDGCLRRELIECGPQRVVERVLRPQDLTQGTVWFGNSLRGLVPGSAIALP
ncbi:MAG: aminodeoxychorismate synthase component I [Micropepsaceae bacterium]